MAEKIYVDNIAVNAHVLPKISGTTNFTQDVTFHSYTTMLITYSIMGFAWAGKAGLSITEMLMASMATTFMGCMVIITEHFNVPTYIARFIGAFIAAVVILIINQHTPFTNQMGQMMVAIIMPVATGMMIVDGLYTYFKGEKKTGLYKIKIGTLCSAALGLAVFIATTAIGV